MYNDENYSNKGKKGKSFRGGKKKERDNWYGYDDQDFQRWWHREGKSEYGGRDIEVIAHSKKRGLLRIGIERQLI